MQEMSGDPLLVVGGRSYVVAVTPATLLKVVVPGMLMNDEQKGLAEALLDFRARSTLSLLHTILSTITGLGSLPLMRTSRAKTDVYSDRVRNRIGRCIMF